MIVSIDILYLKCAIKIWERVGWTLTQSTIIYIEEQESLVHVGAANSC